MRIEDVNVFLPAGEFRRGSVEFDETISHVETRDSRDPSARPYLIPGLVEIHSHGAMNCDHSDGDAYGLREMAGFYAKNGVTSFLSTTMTYSEDVLLQAMQNIRQYRRGPDEARCAGINMEGPFLSREKKGAHMAEMLRGPDVGMFERMQEASGRMIRLVSVAPEAQGGMEFIRAVSPRCRVSVGHSAAGYDTAMRAFESGAAHVTHLFNAMNPFLHRDPGIVGAAMDAGADVEVICDGIHLHPSMVRAVFRVFGERVCLISDSIRSAGLPDGDYESGGMAITVQDGKAVLTDGTIAGSNISLMQGVRHAAAFGIPLEKAVRAATLANARAIGMEGGIGVIARGANADMVLLDRNLEIMRVYIGGKEIAR
jgi:N-acetylglucosamine-6-phosphate deacetylase